jgi:hypothetical protein
MPATARRPTIPITTPAIHALLASFSFAGSAVGVDVAELVGSEVCDARVVPVEAGLALVSVENESEVDSEEDVSDEEKSEVKVISSSKVPGGTSP